MVVMHSASREREGTVAPLEAKSLRLRTGQSFLERMGVLYADRIRLKIVTELYMREMSPKQFFEQVGGSSYDSVRRHFIKLADYGWLRRVRTESTGRGRPEHLYRSTELAIIDDETWEQIPVSIRDSFTVQNVLEMGERLEASLTEGFFDARRDSTLSFTSLRLDEKGWGQAIDALNGCFRSLSQEQTDAKVRLGKSGDSPILMIVELGGFEFPQRIDSGPSLALPVAAPARGAPPWPRRISKIFSDPLNLEIISRLNRRTMSPTELSDALGGISVEELDRKCKMLVKLGWVVKVDQRTGGYRRGATENFYRATSPAASEAELFSDMPEHVRRMEGWRIFERFCQSALSAVRAGTFNQRPERHLTLSTLLVDELGWSQVIASLRACSRSLAGAEQEARRRLAAAGDERACSAGFLIAGFAHPLPS